MVEIDDDEMEQIEWNFSIACCTVLYCTVLFITNTTERQVEAPHRHIQTGKTEKNRKQYTHIN